MRCPRCKAYVEDRAPSCPRCAAPLALRDEPAPGPLDRDLSLDRRGGRRAEGTPAEPGARPRVTPRFWVMEKAPEQPPESPPRQEEPLDAAAVREEEWESGFEILGPLAEDSPAAPEPQGGDAAPGPAQAPRSREARPRAQQFALPFPAEIRLTRAPSVRRVAAWAVDGALAGALSWLLVAGGSRLAGLDEAGAALLPACAALAGLLHFAHATLGHGLAGMTLGKRMLGLMVVGPDGRRPGPGRAAARAALSLVSAAPLGLGLLPALLDRKGRAFHDLLARTAVVLAP